MSPGDIVTFNLPDIADPDNDSFTVTILLQQTISFTKITNNLITFSPADKDGRLTPYIIKIILKDENPIPKSKEYSLSVTVNPIAQIINN